MKEVEERKEQLYAHVLAAYKDFCKRMIEEAWVAEQGNR